MPRMVAKINRFSVSGRNADSHLPRRWGVQHDGPVMLAKGTLVMPNFVLSVGFVMVSLIALAGAVAAKEPAPGLKRR